uniref:Uncharacterized protein n=1 Tax=Moniliophthora roreri TaxID=221103 RepID=A0A0W0GA83_MONRR
MADQLQLYFSSLDGANVSHIAGNASDKVKAFVADLSIYYRVNHPELKATFCDYIIPRIKVTEVSVLNNAEEPLKAEGRVVCSLTVEEDMVNASKNLHGGCSSFLVDMDLLHPSIVSALFGNDRKAALYRISTNFGCLPLSSYLRRRAPYSKHFFDIGKSSGIGQDRAFLADPTTLEDVSGQGQLVKGFGHDIISRMVVTEVSVNKKQEEPLKQEGRVVVKMKVEQDMVHGGLRIHGGCLAFIIDMSVPLIHSGTTFD